jgi:HlyD family secretion protein
MDIVPQDRGIVIDAMLNPTDAAEVQIGMPAKIRLNAFHDRKAPVLQAVVSEVSADSFVDEKSGARFFNIELRIAESELLKIRKEKGEFDLRPGLNVEVIVSLRKRTALTYLTEPIGYAFLRVGRQP